MNVQVQLSAVDAKCGPFRQIDGQPTVTPLDVRVSRLHNVCYKILFGYVDVM